MQSRVVSAQLARGITFDVPLDATMAGLVEAWALGTPWSTILGLTSLSEGDIIRLLRRVLDLLRQIPRLPYVPVSLSETTASRQREAKPSRAQPY